MSIDTSAPNAYGIDCLPRAHPANNTGISNSHAPIIRQRSVGDGHARADIFARFIRANRLSSLTKCLRSPMLTPELVLQQLDLRPVGSIPAGPDL
jgi:hypothetical protein